MTTFTIDHLNDARAELRRLGVMSPTVARLHARAAGIAAAAAPPPPPTAPKRKPIPPHVATGATKERSAMSTKRLSTTDHHAALAKSETRLGLSSGAHLDLGARAERVQHAAERTLDPKAAARADQKAQIDAAMGIGPRSGGVRDEGRRQVFEPPSRGPLRGA